MLKIACLLSSYIKFGNNSFQNYFFSNDYGVNYFKQFNIVLNALDNRVARNHVNRMCLAANVPLIETGTAGYAGQVFIITNIMNTQDFKIRIRKTLFIKIS